MKKALLSLFITATVCGYSQTPSLQWEKNVNGQASGADVTKKAWKDAGGNFYITGQSNNDAFAIKTDANGNILSKFTYDGPQKNVDYGIDIKADASGNIYLAGTTQYNGLATPFVVKFNSSGVKLWEYIEPNLTMDGAVTALALDNYTSPGNLYFTGSKTDSALVVRVNPSNGIVVWEKRIQLGKLNDIDIDNNGHPLVCGYVLSNFTPNNPDLFAAQLDINTGYPQRYTTYDGPQADSINHAAGAIQHFDMAAKIKAGPAGTYIVVGSLYDNPNEATIYLLKFGSAGNTPVWLYAYNSPTHTEGEGVQVQADASFSNFYYVAKANHVGFGYSKYTIAGKVNSSGTAVWEKEFIQGYTGLDPQDMVLDANGNAHVVANTSGSASDIYYMKLASSTGTLSSSLSYDSQRGGGNALDQVNSVYVDNTNHPCFFGSSDAYTYTMEDALMVRLNTNSTLDWDLTFDYFINTSDNIFKTVVMRPIGNYGDQIITCGTVYNNISNTDAIITSYSNSGSVLFQTTFDENNGNDSVIGFEALQQYGSLFLCTSGSYPVTITQYYTDGTINGIPQHPAFTLTQPRQFKTDTLANSYITAYGLNSDDYRLGIFTNIQSSVNNNPNNASGNNAYSRDIAVDNLGNSFIAGVHETGNSPIIRHIMVQKYNISGSKIWSVEIMGLDSTSSLIDVAKIEYDRTSSAVYITATGKGVSGNQLFTVIAKVDLNGNILWVKKYNSSNTRSEYVKDLKVKNGYVFVTGYANLVSNTADNYLFAEKWDVNGNFIWDKTYNGSTANTDEAGKGLVVDYAGNVFIAGYCNGLSGNMYDMLTLKLDVNGNIIWKKLYNGNANGNDMAKGVTLSVSFATNPRVFVYGNVEGSQGTNSDIATLKYCDLPAVHVITYGHTSICLNSSVNLGTSGITGGGNVEWSNGSASNTVITIGTSGTYYYTYTELDGCSENSDSVHISIKGAPATVQICMVTVDSLSTHNIITWDKTTATPDVVGFKMYREDLTNIYTYLGSVSIDSLSEYHDYGANPNVTTKRYKISTLDSCGNESVQSNYHNTIYIVNVGNGQYLWNPIYTIENTPNPVSSYVLLRDDNNTGNFQQIASTAGTSNTLNDVNYANFPNGNWRVDALGFNCNPTQRLSGGNNSNLAARVKSHSNQSNNRVSGINKLVDNGTVNVYPNPSTGSIVIVNTQKADEMKITDVLGNIIYETKLPDVKTTLSIQNSGVYFITVISGKEACVKKVVITN